MKGITQDQSDCPSLAQSRGIYREQASSGALAGDVKCFWTHHLPEPARVAVVPDGCVDIIWISGGLAVVGPDKVAAFPQLVAGETVVGARFRIGAAASWLRTPLDAITGKTVALDAFWGRVARVLEAQIAEAADAETRIAVLRAALQNRLPTVKPPSPEIAACVSLLENERMNSVEPIRALVEETGTSERTLRRRCREHFGYGAKTLDRILRLQRFLVACRASPQSTLATLALDAGYADQAHLNREAKQLTSLTPGDIQQQLADVMQDFRKSTQPIYQEW
ncbi:helix-turn-helix domain-containing protein [Sinorhizobium terangae]|uniref:Helix-turn-helix domain-containing protein n=1 Tax=Sinorhizobium terangae TaxID=110322 RepID=A0A6N7LG86_SINTE|nr:helix-turn-helix domain-containing protein [Sinorhizobium terangae]MBB4188179.1 AraC-like DNA-binding protein [Sinorhizobium terangae]MQX16229.1 helix-turn-helix domain-containing protein [Sinorhizobium terangae]WFU49378.1 helix-turn-helix domain-containing protein [Sinorhizobium terangae]